MEVYQNKEKKELENLIKIVQSAGKLFEEGFNATKEVSYKGSVDLVTQYDVAVENFLKEKISMLLPEYTIIGEESSDEFMRAKKAIYIDPIDGTTNFVHKIPICAISVGVWIEGKAEIAIVYNPILNELFYAKRNEGAFCNGKKISVTSTESLQRSLLATGFPYTKVEKGRDYRWVLKTMENLLPFTQDIRRLGAASIDLCYVANGIFDGFYECNLKPWDVAAGVLIVEEAGGKISNHKGDDYCLGDPIIVATNGRNHDALIEKLADYEEL
jgi:myo-inositol-1(or 4)-monophosphatase